MPRKALSVAEAKATLSDAIRDVEAGGTVLITRRGQLSLPWYGRRTWLYSSASALRGLRAGSRAWPEAGRVPTSSWPTLPGVSFTEWNGLLPTEYFGIAKRQSTRPKGAHPCPR
jgi:hypothetical protein